MRFKLILVKDIINFLGDELVSFDGSPENAVIDNLADLKHVTQSTLDWIQPSPESQRIAEESKARTLLVSVDVKYSDSMKRNGKILLHVHNPKQILAKIGNAFFVDTPKPGIHHTAIITSGAEIGENVYIGPYTVIGKANIGAGCIIESNVRIYDDVTIGENCRIKSGAIIGGEGFGFERDNDGNRFRFPQIGRVKIGNYVEIGANTCIDRGALSDTVIADYVKIDNLCHIAHNVQIGKNTVVVSGAEISGSCKIGENSWIGPHAAVRDQKTIGSNVLVGMGAVVMKNIPDNAICAGNPAKII